MSNPLRADFGKRRQQNPNVPALQVTHTPITREAVTHMGREARRKLKTIEEHITQTPELPKRLAFMLRHPWIGVVFFLAMSPAEITIGAWRGARTAQKASADVIGVFFKLAIGINAE